jgi:flagellar hook-basal body protein
MDNALYVGLSRQMTLRRELDIVANNIANANTTGFKVEDLMVAHRAGQAGQDPGRRGSPVKFVHGHRRGPRLHAGRHDQDRRRLRPRHRRQGLLQDPDRRGERYTRDGRFTTNSEGQLVTQSGYPVLDDGGGPITIDPSWARSTIGQDGTRQPGRGPGRQAWPWCVPTTWARWPRTATTSTATPPTPPWQPRRTLADPPGHAGILERPTRRRDHQADRDPARLRGRRQDDGQHRRTVPAAPSSVWAS